MNVNSDNYEAGTFCCASCGITENNDDDIKLKKCTACYLVQYCSIRCQRDHRRKHKRACKKRVVELRDELLFKQPDSTYLGDCPICCLPLPLDRSKSAIMTCCSKVICNGCDYANTLRELQGGLENKCPFCRKAPYNSKEERDQRMMMRIEANCTVAMVHLGTKEYIKNNHSIAFDWFSKAAELGDVGAHMKLAGLYEQGHGVEKDSVKEIYHLEEAAIGGHPAARYDLGCRELQNGNDVRALKHWIIAATQGDDDSTKRLMDAYKAGFVSKEELASALRAHQTAVDATNNPQREEAEEYHHRAMNERSKDTTG